MSIDLTPGQTRDVPESPSVLTYAPADKEKPITFVVIPEFVARHWWERLLYNQSANRLRRALLGRAHTVVVNVPYRREKDEPVPTEITA